jgi:hypothetical protein
MGQYDPISVEREFMSNDKQAWLLGELREGLNKGAGIANVVSSLSRPTHPEQTIWHGYSVNEKLHDREPEAIVKELERRWPDFFVGFPMRTGIAQNARSVSSTIKKAFVGDWCRTHIRLGLRAYGKPGLRSKKSDIQAVR